MLRVPSKNVTLVLVEVTAVVGVGPYKVTDSFDVVTSAVALLMVFGPIEEIAD